MELSAILWCIFNNHKFDGSLPLPKDGRVSFETQNQMKKEYWQQSDILNL